jgi:uncharacterized protein YdaL
MPLIPFRKIPMTRSLARILILFLLCFTAGMTLSAAPPVPEVLVVHDSKPGPLPPGLICGNAVLDLLGHFGLHGKLISVDEYRAGDLEHHRAAIILGVDEHHTTYPAPLLNDIRAGKRPVMWIAGHLLDLLSDQAFVEKLGFKLTGPKLLAGFQSIAYKDRSLLKGDATLFPVEIQDPAKVQVLATAKTAKGEAKPYVVRSGSFWYFADSPFSYAMEGDRYLAFCDLLHDFLGIPHQEERKALVRIEDVSIETDPERLIAIADYLASRKVPFQVGLTPIFRDPERHEEVYLSDRPQFVRAIRYMVSKGGVIVLHGSSHQLWGKTGDDYEFWDDKAGKPIPGDSKLLVEEKVRAALEECFKNGIYPVTWETPHYMGSQLDYQAISQFFNSSWERVASLDNAEAGHYFPFPSEDRFGRFIIPESLGYINGESPNTAELLTNAERLQALRDGVASFFYHPFLDLKYLKEMVEGLQERGFQFISIRDYDLRIQQDDRLVQTFTQSIRFKLKAKYLHRFFLHRDGRISDESYIARPRNGMISEPGIVPADAVLVMEGLNEILSPQTEPPPPSRWETFKTWVKEKFKRETPEQPNVKQPHAVVLWEEKLPKEDWNNQASYESALGVYGFDVKRQPWKASLGSVLDPETILVVPHAVAMKLGSSQVDTIVEFVGGGGNLVVDGPSPLTEKLGVKAAGRNLKVHSVNEMLFGTQRLTWAPGVDVPRFTLPNPIAVYARDRDSEIPLVVLGRHQRGRFLYLGARFDPNTKMGYSRFPYLVHYVREGFSITMPLQSPQLELYFDPALAKRQGIEDRLAEQWRKQGVRVIYAAAYQFWPKWSYNYEHLIKVCHRNGILVYAWFELPHVSMKFWEEHPEWRAKTPTGRDGLVGWRHHMDLDIPACRESAYGFVADLIKQYDWDGVNLAELNYDTQGGPERPDDYLPMGATTRTAFASLSGFDPIQLFKPDSPHYWKLDPKGLKAFEDFRTQRVLDWHRSLLEVVSPIAAQKDMEVIVTMLDSLHSKSLMRDTGVNSNLILSLMDRFPFTLQVEDPAHFWTSSPDRYKEFADTYLKRVRDPKRLMFDINVVPDRDITHSLCPTPIAAGLELAQTLAYAAQGTGRAAIYSEGTIPFEDLDVLAKVLSRSARLTQSGSTAWSVTSAQPVHLVAPAPGQAYLVDGQLWSAYGDQQVVLPSGQHKVEIAQRKGSWVDLSLLDLRLLRFSADLQNYVLTDRGFRFDYDSTQRALALLSREPYSVLVDGREWEEKAVNLQGRWSLHLPRGKHAVEILTSSTASAILDTTSLYSSTWIAIFGAVACGLMLLIYMSILVRRAVARVGGKAKA